ncbi:hypothetical protein BC937DRAFT_89164 [Endogone sp. FLAS-F59071]|nr:hypothetical protein BC937DRAFT_89164 [Endogone sp. FLAS-F59071]|eukprot:RUS18083.1 hypothetical protein BC937DRAFT_89164 [Endogone sp. FLAS-F59071]
MLALIWRCESPILSATTTSDPYVELKKEPSVFKARLPRAFSGKDIDLCFPAYTDEDGTEYENPLYNDLQFKETVNLLREKIDEGKGQHVIVLAGVSGGGKTSATFACATERWAIYLDCSKSKSFYGNLMYTELSSIRSFPPVLDDIPSQSKALNILDMALLSRALLLIMMLIREKVSNPKDWLIAQLRGNYSGLGNTILDISTTLLKQNLNLFVIRLLLNAINACLKINDLLLIYDESQVLCKREYGKFIGSSRARGSWNFLQAYTDRVLGFPITLLLAGTSMHLAGGVSLVTSVGKIGGNHQVQVILKLPFLTPKDVLRNLDAVIDLQGVTNSTRNYLGTMLQGRPRSCAFFIKLLAQTRSTRESKEEEIRELINTWHKEMCSGMADYLRETCENLGEKIDPYQAILDVVSLRVSSNSTYKHAIALLQHGVLPSEKPDIITLDPGSVLSQEVEICTTLESFLLPSIEHFLEERGKTLVDILVDNMSRLQHIQTIGNQLDSAFATAMIQKRGRNVREELAAWTDNKDFAFPDWITSGLSFVTTSNLANSVSLVGYIGDIFSKAPNHYCHAIQPEESAGSDLVLSLVDDEQHVVLMSVSCTISGENVKKEKIMEQALKANLKYQYMERIKKRTTASNSTSKKSITASDSSSKKRTTASDSSSESRKKLKVTNTVGEPPPKKNRNDADDIDKNDSTITDDGSLTTGMNENFDLDYANTAKLFEISKVYENLYKWLISRIPQNYIHVLVELPRRVKPHGTKKRPETFRLDEKGDLIIIVDDRNVEQVFGPSMVRLVESIKAGEDY